MLILPELSMKNHLLLFVLNPDPISLIFLSSCNEKRLGSSGAASCSVSIDFRPGGSGLCPGKDVKMLQGQKFNSLS